MDVSVSHPSSDTGIRPFLFNCAEVTRLSMGHSWWSLSDNELPETMADPVWTLRCVGNTFRVTLFLDLSILTQESIYTYPPKSLSCFLPWMPTVHHTKSPQAVCGSRSVSARRQALRADPFSAQCLHSVRTVSKILCFRESSGLEGLVVKGNGYS